MLAGQQSRADIEFEGLVASIFRKGGWRVRRASAGAEEPDRLLVDLAPERYLVEVKVVSEPRRDRLIPLLSQAVLRARALARCCVEPTAPLAIVAVRHIPASLAVLVLRFARHYAPDVAVGVIDADGFRSFAGTGLNELNARPVGVVRRSRPPKPPGDLFSDLNQWMMKILIGQPFPASLISIPREPIQNAAQLARAARVSVMSASRLVHLLSDEGYLGQRDGQLQDAAARLSLVRKPGRLRRENARPRCCIGGLAGAGRLGFGFACSVVPHVYVEHLDLPMLRKLGISPKGASRRSEVQLRVPANTEAVFRAAVLHDGLPVCDVLQLWLDASANPEPGFGLADEIRRRVLQPLLGRD